MKKLVLSALWLVAALPASAHDGHAAAREAGVLHWLTEADHLAALGLSLIVALGLVWGLRRSRQG